MKALGGDDDVEIENSIVDGESTSLLLSYDAASANIRDALSAHTGPDSVAFLELGSTGDVGITEQQLAGFADVAAVASNYYDDDESGSFAPPHSLAVESSVGPARSWKSHFGSNDIQHPHPYFDVNVDNAEEGENIGASQAIGVAAVAAGARVLRVFGRSDEEDDQDPDAFDVWDVSEANGDTPGAGEGNADVNPGQAQ